MALAPMTPLAQSNKRYGRSQSMIRVDSHHANTMTNSRATTFMRDPQDAACEQCVKGCPDSAS
jgi:hypothetical protein